MSKTSLTDMIILINDQQDLTSWFKTAADGSSNLTFRDVVFSKRNTTIEAKFSSGKHVNDFENLFFKTCGSRAGIEFKLNALTG